MSCLFALLLLFAGCKKSDPRHDPITRGDSYGVHISTDKAFYKPGDNVMFTIDKIPAGSIKIRYRHQLQTLGESPLTATTWTWKAPATDYTGYMVDLYVTEDGKENVYGSIGVDVSSDVNRFPRNGFLSAYGALDNAYMSSVMSNLNRHHINVVQFQDWKYKHHLPLAGTPAAPASMWKDIANRDNYFSTVKKYIDLAHGYNMLTLSYNLAYGALSDAAADGVAEEWYLFKDRNHATKDFHGLSSPFKSSIYLTNPANPAWQQYIAGKTADVYAALPFDGYQVDQLGSRGTTYDYYGNSINLENTFPSFLTAMKTAAPAKKLVMNAVNQYGQQQIASSPVDFLYTEPWAGNESYHDLASIIQNNSSWSANKKTVLAAYMNYNLADNKGFFNTPGVLLTDAVIFAFGGSHLELGEHMLGKEYFPNSNLQVPDDLKQSIIQYYDFLVGYENLLNDGGTFNTPAVECTNGAMSLNAWPPVTGKVSVVGKTVGDKQILHLINMANASSFDWRDTNGNQKKPNTLREAAISYTTTKTVSKVWIASPDLHKGVAVSLPFTQTGNIISFTLPSLQYWDMVVVE